MSLTPALQILFIDAAVTDVATLLASIDPSIEVVQLAAGEDGLAQIARALAGRSGIDAVHIISHGEPGALTLGGTRIDAAALDTHAADLAVIRAAMGDNGDMLLYGCDVAAGAAGAAFTEALAAATGADIAASTDITGSALHGGNWTLENHVGSIETAAIHADTYNATLGNDGQLPAGLSGNGPWNWGGHTYQTKLNGSIDDSDPENPLRAGNKWDRYVLSGVAAGTTVYVYMGNSSSVDDFLQVDRNGTIITQDDDSGDGERSYDAYISWVYQPGDVIRATTYSAGYRGSYSLFIGTSNGSVATGTDIGNAPAPVPVPNAAPTFTDSVALINTYADGGAIETFSASTGTFTATDATPTSTMRFGGGGVGSFGSLAVASNGAYSYTPDAAAINALAAGQNRTDTFTVSVSDGSLQSTKTVTVNITGANDAPTLSAGVAMPAVLEDTAGTSAANPGRTVSALIGGVFADVDTGASLGGMVIVGNAATGLQGSWQYSTDGTNWFDVGTVSTSSGLALAAGARLHFVPAADYYGPVGALTVHAADNLFTGSYTSGATRQTFDTTSDAATSGVSVAGHDISTSVTAVNDAPVISSAMPSVVIADTAAYDSSAFATTNTATGTLTATDIDSPVGTLSYAIRGGTLSGDAATGSWTKVGVYGTLTLDAATHAWSYVPGKAAALNALADGETGHDVFEFKVTDAAGASSVQTIDVSLTGTNDTPVLAHAIADQSFSGAGSWSYQIPADSFTDAEGRGLTYTVDVLDGNGMAIDTIGSVLGGDTSKASSWLRFDEATRTFSGDPTPSWNNAGLTLRVTASDGQVSATGTFALNLTATGDEAPHVGTPLKWHAVQDTHESANFLFGNALGGSTITFDGTSVTVGTAVTGTQVAASYRGAFTSMNMGYTATVPNNDNVLILTANSAGDRTDFTAATESLPGGGFAIRVATEGADALRQEADVRFANLDWSTDFTFAGVRIVISQPMTGAEVVDEILAQLTGNGVWTATRDPVQTDVIHFVAVNAGASTDLSAADFGVDDVSNAPNANMVSVTAHGADAVTEVVEITFDGNYGGADIDINGVGLQVGATINSADVASALAAASYTNYSVTDLGNGSIHVTALAEGNQTDIAPGSFSGANAAPTRTAQVDGAGWTYTIPAGTFVDPEASTLVYTAFVVDPVTGVASGLVDSATLAFDASTATFSGTGATPANTQLRVVATDIAGHSVSSQFELAVTHGATIPSLTLGIAAAPATFVAGAGTGTGQYILPSTAFHYNAEFAPLGYSATVVDANGDPLPMPAWLHFDPSTATFSGNPPNGSADVSVTVTASAAGVSSVTTAPIVLHISAANDPLVLAAPIADQSVSGGSVFGFTSGVLFADPDGTAAGATIGTAANIAITATANGQALSTYGLIMTVNANGSVTFGGNPSAAEPYLNIVVTGTEVNGGTSASTSFTLNLNEAPAAQGSPQSLAANNPGTVTISGTPAEGGTLTATLPTDADGVPSAGAVRYQWQVSSDSGATWHDVAPDSNGNVRGQSNTLVLAESESTKDVRVQAFYNDGGGVAETPVSNVLAIANVDTAGVVSVTGVLTPGETLNATIADGDGLQTAVPSYQWYRDNVAVTDATYSNYTLTNADGGHTMTVAVSYFDDHGTETVNLLSGATATVMLGAVKPTAVNDSGSATEASGVGNNVAGTNPTGNVLTNDYDTNSNLRTDIPIASVRNGGAEGLGDAASLTGDTYTIAGQYGVLTINRVNGAWTYAVDQNNTMVDALGAGQNLVDSFNYTIGDTTGLFDTAVLNITVNGANDAPTLVGLPTTAVFVEDIAAAIRTSFSIVDPDGGSGFGLQLTVIKGTLRGEEPAGYTRPAGLVITGTDTQVLTISANSMADVQNWLSATALMYTSGPNQNGSLNDTLTYGVRDTSSGAFANAGTTALTVDHDNNPPVVDVGGAATAGNDFTTTFRPRGGEVAVVASDAHISDIDSTDTIMSATVSLATGAYDNLFGTTYETLRSTAGSVFNGATANPITFQGNGTGTNGLTGATTLTLTGYGSRADYENALKTIVYNDSNPNAFSGTRTVTISVTDDSGAASNTGSFATATANNLIAVGQRIFIDGHDTGYTVGEIVDSQHFVASGPLSGLVPGAALQFYGSGNLVTSAVQTGPVVATTTILVPWTPVIDMNGDSLAGRDHTVTYTEGQAGVAIATSDASITDQDGNIASVAIHLDNPINGSSEKLFISSALVTQLGLFGITVSGNNSATITLTYDVNTRPNGVDATYFQIGLRSVQYANSSDYPDLSARTVSVTSTDVDGNTGVGAHTTINMVGVNDAPAGTDGAVTALEDTPLALTAANFGFTDIDGNVLAAVKISSLPTAGALVLDGAAVASGQVISLADINAGKLVFTPALNHSGAAHASFGFQVQDNGGTALGGIDLDPIANTLTINVTPVNDAPVLTAAAPQLVTIGENAANNAGQLVSSFVGSGLGHTGVADVDTLNGGGAGSGSEAVGQGIAIHGLSNDGPATGGNWQYSLNGGTTWVNVGTVSDGASLLLRATDMIRFQPDGLNATTATLSYYLWDGASGAAGSKVDVSVRGGSTAFSTGTDTSTISVTPANDAPVIDLNGSAGGTDLTTIFRPRGDAVSVVGNDIVITDPDRLAGGADDTLVSAVVTLTGGALDNLFGTIFETLSSTSVASFAGSLGAIAIAGNGTGVNGLTGATALTLTGAGTHADYQNALKTIVYNNTNPNAFSGNRTVTIVVHDASATTGNSVDGLNSAVATTTIQVPWTPVIDMNGDIAPGRNGAVTFVERSAGVAIASADASIVDQDGNIKSVTVTLSNHPDGSAEKLSISSALVTQLGTLGLTITGLDSHQITITGNKDGSVFQLALRAIQYSNSSAAPSPADRIVNVSSIDMQNNTGVGASTIIHITTINDAPVGVNGTLALTEDTDYAMQVADFGFTDVEGHALGAVIITTLPTAGTLKLNGVALVAGQEVSAAAIAAGQLVYHPVANSNNVLAAMPTLTFQVRDAGGVLNGGIDLDVSANTLTLNIAPVNDLPTAGNGVGTPSVAVTGVLQQGQVLTATIDIADVDRTAPQIVAATSYQWQVRDVPAGTWTNIVGATASTFTLTAAEANHEVRVVATYADDIAISSVLSYVSDRADAPAIVADAFGNIVLSLDTDLRVLIVDPIGDVTISNDGTGPVTIENFADGHELNYAGDGPLTLVDPVGDIAIDSAGPGVVTVTGLTDGAAIDTAGDGDVTISDPEGAVTLGNNGPGTVTIDGLNDGETLLVHGDGPTTVSNPDGDLAVDALGNGPVTVTGLNDDATVSTAGAGTVLVADPEGSVTLDNAGPGVVTIDSLNAGETLHAGGNGYTTVADPDGDLTVVNSGPGIVTVTGLNDDATLSTSGGGDVEVGDPEGSLTLNNAGGGTVTISSLNDGETLHVSGNGPTTVSNPDGDLTIANAGLGIVTIQGLLDDATVDTSGAGSTAVDDPAGSLTLNNAGSGSVDVTGLNDGETLHVGGAGETTVSAPDGDLTVENAGPGTVRVNDLHDGATLHTAGAGDVVVSDPLGEVTLDNAGPGTVLVAGVNAGETVHVGGEGPTNIANPHGDLAITAAGNGPVVVTDLLDGVTLATSGAGDINVQDPQGSLALDNAGPGTVNVSSLNDGATLHVSGSGPTSVSDPDGDLTLANDGPGLATVNGLHDGATLATSGDGAIAVRDPLGSVTLDNAGPGVVIIESLNAGETLHAGGNGYTIVADPDGDLTVVNDGSGVIEVTGLNDDATLSTSGAGDITVTSPEGNVNLDNAGPGSVAIITLHAGETVNVSGAGDTTLLNPDGDVNLANAGPGLATVTFLNPGATVHTSGDGDVAIAEPFGDVNLVNDGRGAVSVANLNDGAVLTASGAGATTISNPDGDLTIHNAGPGVATVAGLQADATVHTAGDGAVTVDDPSGGLVLDNAGSGTVTVAGLNIGETLQVSGSGPTTVANPDGDLGLIASGPGDTTVTGLLANAAVTIAGDGNVTIADPSGNVNLANHGSGTVTVDGLHSGDTVHVAGDGPTVISNPAGTVIVDNDGPGVATITGLLDGASVGISGNVIVSDPQGSLYLDNAGPGTAKVAGLHDGATVHSEGAGFTAIADPVGDVNVDAFGGGIVSIFGLGAGAAVSTVGNGDVTIEDPSGSVTLDNAGLGAVTVEGINTGETLHVSGAGPTTVASPDGDVTIVNDGPATATVTGLHAAAVLNTSGDGGVEVSDPLGSLSLNNGGAGAVTVDGINAGETIHVAGNGPTLVANPDGDVTVANDGPGVATVSGLNDGATLHTVGAGAFTVNDPEGSVTLDNAGQGNVDVQSLNDGATLHVGGAGSTLISNPDGDLDVVNDGPGVTSVSGLLDGATIATSGDGDIVVSGPQGSVNLNAAGNGTAVIDGIHAGETLHVSGNGPSAVTHPLGDLAVVNDGPGVTSVIGLVDDAVLATSGDGNVTVSAPQGSLTLANAGAGSVTVDGMLAGETVHAGGNGATTINQPEGDITIVNDGPAVVTVAGLVDDATVTTSGDGDITLTDPAGGVALNNSGAGTVTVDGVNNNETVSVTGNGPTTIANPDGDLAVANAGPGVATVTGLNNGANIVMSGTGAVTVSAPEGDLVLVNAGSGAATVDHLGDGAALTVNSASSTLVSAPVGDATLHNLGTGLMTVAGAQSDSQLNVTGNGAYALDLSGFPANGHITLNNVDGATLQVLHAPAGATIDALGAGDTTILAPSGDLHIHNAGTGTMVVEQPADGITVSKTGSGPALIDHPLGSFTLANDDTGAVTVQHLAAGATLVLEGTGPVVVDSSLAHGEHLTIDTSGNSNVQLANNGQGVIDVVGDLRLDSGDGMSIHLNGPSTTAMTVAGAINLDGTPLHLTLDPNYAAHLGDTITLLNNDGSDAVVGTFADLAEGAPIYLGGSLFRISYVGGTGNDVVLTRVNDVPTGLVAISGTTTQYQTLSASNTIGDTDGMGNVSYRWLADGAMVAVGASFALTQAEVGKAITLVASYTDAEGTVEHVTSEATARVANVNDAPTGAVLIAGNATLGQTLVASNGLADIDGLGTIHYQWQANGVNIAGATADSLVLTSATIGKTITAVASYSDAYGAAESVTSSATVPVRDGNGVAPSTEALAPPLHSGGLAGDGNGDGVLDALQSSVVSMAVPSSSGSGSSYMTLVADSVGGKPVDGANPLSNVSSVHNGIALPSWAQAPSDAITFTSKVAAPGATENFSLYVDASLGINGFWAKDSHGVLVNLASAAYGGQMVTEGDKVRLDFHIKEGSEFDAGVAGDTNIVSTGVAAHASLSLIGYVIDTPNTAGHGSAFD